MKTKMTSQKHLLIVESPTKVKTIQKYLDNSFIVNSSKGHIYELSSEKEKFGLGFNLQTLEPHLKIIEGKEKLVSELKTQADDADIVYIASDPDREGEAIAYHLIHALNIKNKYKRLEFNEITEKGIKLALQYPRLIDTNLYHSQKTRRFLDRIIGFRLSRVVDLKIGSKSAGRVQSVALKLIAEREKEVRNFVSTKYYTIQANFEKPTFSTKLFQFQNKKIKITSLEQVDNLKKSLSNKFLVDKIDSKKFTKKNPFPLITSTLIQKSKMPAAKTMQIAQKLYELGHITYMRTDSIRLSDDFKQLALSFIEKNYGFEYCNPELRVKNNNNNVQDAHEAIRVTNLNLMPQHIESILSDEEAQIYELIYNYSLGALMSPAQFIDEIVVFNNNDYQFKTTFRKKIFPGYLKLFLKDIQQDEGKKPKDEDEIDLLVEDINIDFKIGQVFMTHNIKYNECETKPPYRYNEARLVKVLEEEGIGRPSTYSSIISRLLDSNYVYKYNNNYYLTIRGESTSSFLQTYFAEEIQEKYTSEMEKCLDLIAENKLEYSSYLHKFIDYFMPKVEDVIKNAPYQNTIVTNLPCPNCSKGKVVIKKGYKNKEGFLSCSEYPECRFIANLKSLKEEKNQVFLEITAVEKPSIEYLEENCPLCQSKLVMRNSKKGQFIGCSSYPKCRYARTLDGNILEIETKKPIKRKARKASKKST
ncbi:MAG: type I DNA topoisomerase [Mycoplasma sp.]